jgi:uncharacterized protein
VKAMLKQIIEYREQGLSFRKIAKEMNTTVGRVQYQWVKYQKSLDEAKSEVAAASEKTERMDKPKRQGKFKGRISLKKVKRKPLKAELTVMFSDPTRILCYWDIPSSIIQQVREFQGLRETQFQHCLRVFDITSISFDGHNHHGHTDIIIQPHAAHWFINSLKPNRAYCVEYGIIDVNGHFTAITRSSVFHTPRTGYNQEYHQLHELHEFETGAAKMPQWVEHVSTYSYYLKN